MAGWQDWIFGNLPPPVHPASSGATFGAAYQNMPDTTAGIDDRRQSDFPHTYVPSRPHDLNWQSTNAYNKFDPASFSAMVATEKAGKSWANNNLPAQLPTTPLADPDYSPDPSIIAQQRAWEAQMARSYPPNWQGPSLPDGSERGPQFTPDQMQSALQLWQTGQ